MSRLSDRRIQGLRAPGRYGDGAGLHLHVRRGGSRSWVLRKTLAGRRTDFSLGPYPDLSLADAREKAREWRRLIREGRDPRAVSAAAAVTFEAAAREFHAAHADGWVPGHAVRWIRSLELDVFPALGARPLGTIKAADVAESLRPIWHAKPDTALRLRQRITAVFEWAVAAGHLEGASPVVGLPRLLRPVKREVQHFRSLPWQDVPALFVALGRRDGMAARVLAFLLLTAARSGEARGARWAEVTDAGSEGPVWTIPVARMKTRVPHRVPLAPPAVALLEELGGLDAELVFPSNARRGPAAPLTAEALSRLRRRMGIEGVTTAHGLRATFKTWGAETSRDRTLVELCLSHAHGDRVEQAYLRSDLLRRRREIMEAWARHVTGDARAGVAE